LASSGERIGARMPIEIERKFLVTGDGWRLSASVGERLREGLLARMEHGKVRVRRGERLAWVTIKGPKKHISRQEFEYEVPVEDADEMLATLCEGPIIEKTRYRIPYEGLTWAVDVFSGGLDGLIIAEVELADPEQAAPLPHWIGSEVTGNPQYSSAAIARAIGKRHAK
jgi:adenylate cyclase